MDNQFIFRPVIEQIPGLPDPTSGDYADLQPSYATHGLPDPNITGPCQLQTSVLCEPAAGVQRMDPMAMTRADTAFRGYVMTCQPCYDQRCDEYIRVTHGRA